MWVANGVGKLTEMSHMDIVDQLKMWVATGVDKLTEMSNMDIVDHFENEDDFYDLLWKRLNYWT